jgi:hypothetical protein
MKFLKALHKTQARRDSTGNSDQYQSAKSAYDDLLKKFSAAQGQVERETNQLGETIRIVDPANLPQVPENATKKPLFVVLGGCVGLTLGLFLAAFFEAPRLFKIQNIEDAKYYTGLPVLATVPSLLTETEISSRKRTGYLKVFAGVAAAAASVPILIIVLQESRILERIS